MSDAVEENGGKNRDQEASIRPEDQTPNAVDLTAHIGEPGPHLRAKIEDVPIDSIEGSVQSIEPVIQALVGPGDSLHGSESSGTKRTRSDRRPVAKSDYDRLAMWVQRTIRLPAHPRGFHLITAEVLDALPELGEIPVGILSLLIQHTSASLALNENASPEVRRDFESWFDRAVPEGAPYWTHTLEGEDDMPAHIKAALLGPSLTLPISQGRLAPGTWQSIYLCEHRDHAGPRSLVATVSGESSLASS